ncbi:MAG: hypothetical protein QHJ73_09645 [Armatimonadota bacterium]|nr:hypothetical protein [Armatimonadota bacterium]
MRPLRPMRLMLGFLMVFALGVVLGRASAAWRNIGPPLPVVAADTLVIRQGSGEVVEVWCGGVRVSEWRPHDRLVWNVLCGLLRTGGEGPPEGWPENWPQPAPPLNPGL